MTDLQPYATLPERQNHTRATRALVLATMAGLVVLAGIVVVLLREESGTTELTPWAAVPLALGVVAHLVLDRFVWAQLSALPNGLDTEETWRRTILVVQPNLILRLAGSESIAVFALTLVFLDPRGSVPVLVVATLVSLVLLWLHAYPREAVVRRTQAAVEAKGARTGLAEAFGFTSQP